MYVSRGKKEVTPSACVSVCFVEKPAFLLFASRNSTRHNPLFNRKPQFYTAVGRDVWIESESTFPARNSSTV